MLCALVLQGFYLQDMLSLYGRYQHSSQRLLHTVSLAVAPFDETAHLPMGMLHLVNRLAPRQVRTVSAIPFDEWRPEGFEEYRPPWRERGRPRFGALIDIPLTPDQTFAFRSSPMAASIPALGYLPYALGAKSALSLSLPPLIVLYAAVLTNIGVLIGLGYYTLRLTPILHWPLCALLLLPSVSHMRMLIMPDALAVELSCLLVATALRFRAIAGRLSRAQLWLLFAQAFAMAVVKLTYCPVAMLYWCIPARRFGGRLRKHIILVLLFTASLTIATTLGLAGLRQYHPSLIFNTPSAVIAYAWDAASRPLDLFKAVYGGLLEPHIVKERAINLLTWHFCWLRSGYVIAALTLAFVAAIIEYDTAANLIDLLADARHWCDRHGQCYGDLDRIAHDHYLAELWAERRAS